MTARKRSRKVRSAGGGDRAEHHARIEVDLAPNEPAVDAGVAAGVDDLVQALARRVGDRDEDDVRLEPLEKARQLVHAADHGRTVHAPAAQTRVVVDEPDHALAARLAQLAQQAPPGAPGADDQRAPSGSVAVGAQAGDERALPEP
jgi:hypothetical protein